MAELTKEQVAFICEDLGRQGILNTSLRDDLLDHICCILEQEDDPLEFELKYSQVVKRFARKEIREIQEETDLLITHLNYYTMKNMLIRSGLLAGILIITGSILKLLHLPGAAISFVVATVIFCFVFLPIFFVVEAAKTARIGSKLVLGLGALFGLVFCLAAVFKVQHWPGATLLWRFALAELMLIFLPVYFFVNYRNEATRNTTIITSILILIMGGMLFLLTNLRSSARIEGAQARSFRTIKNLADHSAVASGYEDKEALKKLACARLELVKTKLVDAFSELEGKKLDEIRVARYYGDNYALVSSVLFSDGKPCQELVDFEEVVLKINEICPGSVQVTPVKWNGEQVSWLVYLFKDLPANQVLMEMNLLKLKIASLR